MNSTKIKLIISSAYSAILNVVFVTVLTIWAEFNVPLKDWLKSISGHHWTTKSIFSVLIFALFTLIFFFANSGREDRLRGSLRYLVTFTIIGIAVLSLFFTGHHFAVF